LECVRLLAPLFLREKSLPEEEQTFGGADRSRPGKVGWVARVQFNFASEKTVF